ncbi:MAG TPA: FGGY family carbohydrate kinase [Bacteroidales bacterium]|jgi:xylulokinase|nr:FGGY family carbohydrate kinase [Bacteroidales bacterium]
MYLLGYDIGSSSVKASIVDVNSGLSVAGAFYPKQEMPIKAVKQGWAEQDPDMWWDNLRLATKEVLATSGVHTADIKAIGISYQMHGLVCIGKDLKPLRPSIIWCDSRAVEIGDKAFLENGADKCLDHLLNSPGNFTASKLKWVQLNEPEIYSRIYKIMLPGDYIAMKLTGEICTTISGLSEGMFWDFRSQTLAEFLLKYYGISSDLLPEIRPTFSRQGQLNSQAARDLGLNTGTVVSYRAGDQPNNAFSLNVLEPGEIAATAGTSGVVYGVSDVVRYDPQSRVNTFAHVNYSNEKTRLGVLLCINGTGILNSWLKRMCCFDNYVEMNEAASKVKIGSDGIVILPFGNGAERMLGNKDTGSYFGPVDFNIHGKGHLARAAQEGIVFAFNYGMEIMKKTGIKPAVIRAGHANMFLSKIFRESLAGVSGAVIELYNTDGSQGAAKGAGLGAGYYTNSKEAFAGLKKLATVDPDSRNATAYSEAYEKWKNKLEEHRTPNI